MVRLVSRGGLAWLESEQLARLPWLVHGFSTRQGGVSRGLCVGLNLGFTDGDKRENVEDNRRRFLAELGAQDFAIASARQVHSAHGLIVTRSGSSRVAYELGGGGSVETEEASLPTGDALATAEPGILLTVRIADCLPVLLVDPIKRVVSAVHAGWRGALARIIEKAVGDQRRVFGSDPRKLLAVLGPSIRACCYEVGEEVVDAFHAQFAGAERFFQAVAKTSGAAANRHESLFRRAYPPGHAPEQVPAARLDLTAVARAQFASAGVDSSQVSAADYCTACRTDLFFSHRKEGSHAGRQMAVIGIR